MKRIAKISLITAAALSITSCSTMNKALSGGLIGTSAGAAIGAGIGYLIGKDGKAAAIGAAVGGSVGAGAGVVIGNKMQKKADELAASLENADIKTITDKNGLTAIMVTFDSGILFATNSATLSDASKDALKAFANNLSDLEETDITIWGHTDNTGTYEVNQRVSNNRANSVKTYLASCGIKKERMTAEGKSYDFPVADNSTEAGRAENRRVEIYISANAEMVKEAEEGKLQ